MLIFVGLVCELPSSSSGLILNSSVKISVYEVCENIECFLLSFLFIALNLKVISKLLKNQLGRREPGSSVCKREPDIVEDVLAFIHHIG